jgi:hypothetical protein
MKLKVNIVLDHGENFQCLTTARELIIKETGENIKVLKIDWSSQSNSSIQEFEYISFRLTTGLDDLLKNELSHGFLLKRRVLGEFYEAFWAAEQCKIVLICRQ